jgi:hypothetical protein
MNPSRKLLWVGIAIAWLMAAPAPGLAREPKASRACTSAYQAAERLERENHLLAATKSWQACAKAACGAFLHHECTFRHAQVEGDIPSVVPVITDAAGAPLTDAQVAMDGQLLVAKIDGHAIAIEPGIHEFTFRNGSGLLATETVVVSQGQRNRLIAVALRGSDSPPPPGDSKPVLAAELRTPTPAALVETPPLHAAPEARPRSSVAPYLLGTVGVAGLTGFGLMTYWGRRDNDLLARCSPNCPSATVDHIRKLYLAANISLGVGVAALVGATWIALRGGSQDEEEPRHGRYVFDLRPMATGAAAQVSGAF